MVMKRGDIIPGLVVKNTKTEKIGVLFTGHVYQGFHPESEVPIIYQGEDDNSQTTPYFEITPSDDLEKYELQQKDLLTWEHIREVCRPRTEGGCRYIMMSNSSGFFCAKVLDNTNVAERIDKEIEDGKKKEKGNNCGGRYNSEALKKERSLFSD